jgi:hypothetical protein
MRVFNADLMGLFSLTTMAVDLHKYYFRYIVSYLVNIYVFFVFPEIETA